MQRFAEQWIERHGRNAPADLRRWALVPTNSQEARAFLYEVARIAEALLAEGDRGERSQETSSPQ